MADNGVQVDYARVARLLNTMTASDIAVPLLKAMGSVLVSDARFNFRYQADPDRNKWASTQRGGNILRDTSRLRNSITFELLGETAVEVGTNVEYAAVHQYGFSGNVSVSGHTRRTTQAFGRKLPYPVYQTVKPHQRKMDIPARPFLGAGARSERRINRAIDQWSRALTE